MSTAPKESSTLVLVAAEAAGVAEPPGPPTTSSKLDMAKSQYEQNRQRFQQMLPELRVVVGWSQKTAKDRVIFRRLRYGAAEQTREEALQELQVEPLLQQASALIDRVTAEDPTYRQLRIDQFNLLLDLEQYIQLEEINTDEVAAGLFKVPYWEAHGALQGDDALKTAQTGLKSWLNTYGPKQVQLAAWSAENSQMPLAKGTPDWAASLSDHTLHFGGTYKASVNYIGNNTATVPAPPAGTGPALPPAPPLPSNLAVPALPTPVNDWDGRMVAASLTYQSAALTSFYQSIQVDVAIAPVDARRPDLASRTDYLNKDAGFKERRRAVAHAKLVDRLDATISPSGPLHYADRIAAVEERAAVDLLEAFIRLQVARRGFRRVYLADLPELPLPRDTDGVRQTFLNELITWIRGVGNQMQLMGMQDQDYVHRISLRKVLGADAFKSGRDSGVWTFTLPAKLFGAATSIRLRGLSANAEFDGPPIYAIVVKAPPTTLRIGPNGRSEAQAQKIQPVWIGRLAPANSPRIPDLAGTRAVYNASPVGDWSIEMTPGVDQSDLHHMEDIELNLHLTITAG